MRNTKGELQDLEVDADGAFESITKLQTQLYNETGGKVNIFDDSGQFRNTTAILGDLANIWSSLDSVQKANITTWVAGSNQANVFNSLMTNWADGAEAVETALNSEGSALQENARCMDSIQGRLSQLSATFQELSSNVINSDLFKSLVSGAQTLLSVINQLISTFGTLTTIIAGAGIAAFIKNFAQMNFPISTAGRNQSKEST